MSRNELQIAIASGIFFGVLGVLGVIFLIWIYSPLLTPLAYTLQDVAIKNYTKRLAICFLASCAIFLLKLFLFYFNLS